MAKLNCHALVMRTEHVFLYLGEPMMLKRNMIFSALIVLSGAMLSGGLALGQDSQGEVGELLAPSTFGPGIVESWEDGVARDLLRAPLPATKARNGAQGSWVVPGHTENMRPHSGKKCLINKWGDTRMGISFPEPVDVYGAYFAGQAERGVWAPAVWAIGYRDGEVVQETELFMDIGEQPAWFAMNLRGVDRIVIAAHPIVAGGGWYCMDDLTFSVHSQQPTTADEMTVLDFENLNYRSNLTGSDYAGLVWEAGTGDFNAPREMPPPQVPPGYSTGTASAPDTGPTGLESPMDVTGPTLGMDWEGGDLGDGNAYPPDTMGAMGTDYYVETINTIIMIYTRSDGQLISSTSLVWFFNVSGNAMGDPRVLFDHRTGRWIITATAFYDSNLRGRIYVAVSKTASPIWGGWFKNYFVAAQGYDAGKWVDYPILGVDEDGIYITAFMVGGSNTMSIFALEKAPLIANPPAFGTIRAWRAKPWEGSIQPARTYGNPEYMYLISRANDRNLRLRRIMKPITTPVLYESGLVTVPYAGQPPTIPAMGSTTNVDTGDGRLLDAVYRNGSLWTCNCTSYGGRAVCQFYEINPTSPPTLIQSGRVYSSDMWYSYPSISVNSNNDVVMGFSGGSQTQYMSGYFTGRLASDPAGQMAPPTLLKAGEGPYTVVLGDGRNRWGDYSAVKVDPVDDTTFWTIQEYAKSPANNWGTWVGELGFVPTMQACCMPSGMCSDEEPAACTANGGDPQGAGTECVTFDCPPCRGDLDCSGEITFGDINPFVLALTDPAGWQAQYPGCPVLNGDIDESGVVDFGDINPFVSLLSSGGGQPIVCE